MDEITSAQGGALSALDWWREAGVDMIVDEEPRDWLRPAAKIASPVAPAPAALPNDLAALADWLGAAPALPGPSGARLRPAGDAASGLMMIADMPESGDAEAGAMLSGEIGGLFDRMLAAIGRDRASIYLAPLSPARPAGGRLDAADIMALAPIARRHAALAAPRVLLLLGDAASRAFLGMGVAEARGRTHRFNHDGVTIAVIATFPPRMLLATPSLKQQAWADLRRLLGEWEA